MKARLRGVQVHMQQFEFISRLVLGHNLLQHTDSLSGCVCRESRGGGVYRHDMKMEMPYRTTFNFDMFLRELNFIKLFRCDLTTKFSNGRRTTLIN